MTRFAQLWRRERDRLGSAEATVEQVRKKPEWIAQGDKEVIVFTGNLANPAMRRSFLILGFCYLKLTPQMCLF